MLGAGPILDLCTASSPCRVATQVGEGREVRRYRKDGSASRATEASGHGNHTQRHSEATVEMAEHLESDVVVVGDDETCGICLEDSKKPVNCGKFFLRGLPE